MDSEAKTKGQNSLNILESLMKDGDLKSALETAKQWAGNNPVPSGKSCMTQPRISHGPNKTILEEQQFIFSRSCSTKFLKSFIPLGLFPHGIVILQLPLISIFKFIQANI